MTSYAPNWTPRFKAGYRAAGIIHTIQFRAPRGSNATTTQELALVANGVFDALSALLSDDFEWTESSYALTDSDVFIPCPNPDDVTGTQDADMFSLLQRIQSTTFTGRSATGRARCSLYGIAWDPSSGANAGADFRVTELEVPAIGDAADQLQGAAFAASGEVTLWHRNATIKINDQLLKKVRQGVIS